MSRGQLRCLQRFCVTNILEIPTGDTYPQPRVRIVALVACGKMSHQSE